MLARKTSPYRKTWYQKAGSFKRLVSDGGAQNEKSGPGGATRITSKQQKTREASDDKSWVGQVHKQGRACSLRKELAEGQLYRIQEKHEMTRGEPEEKRRLGQEHRQRQACVLKKSWPKASSTEFKRGIR